MKFLLLFFLFVNIIDAKLVIKDVYKYDSNTISELSALAYDGKTLFALSDYGVLHHFNLILKDEKIEDIQYLKSIKLTDKNGKKLKKKKRDSEGLIYLSKALYISFEGVPRIEKHSLNGQKIKKIKIPKILRDIDNYKSKNKALEALTYSKKYGFITAPEKPLKDEDIHKLYTKKQIFSFKASGKITALEYLKNNTILVIERDFNLLTNGRKITLSKVYIDKCKSNICKKETLKVLDAKADKFVDNYEGLTKIKKNLFLMVSDDNNNILQQTYFILFEIND
ncbi:MAG: esterase-like activity of phytase family protein [Campylobacterota bacterium]|nr:esterase-like activity of phytase family protein [Campylobacterota bacterium]